jgi:hypothetical protein
LREGGATASLRQNGCESNCECQEGRLHRGEVVLRLAVVAVRRREQFSACNR